MASLVKFNFSAASFSVKDRRIHSRQTSFCFFVKDLKALFASVILFKPVSISFCNNPFFVPFFVNRIATIGLAALGADP
jgi:hypothetical protein